MKKKIHQPFFLSFVILNLFYSFFSFSQSLQPYYIHYSIQDGLPSSEIYTVIQDSKGYLWFGTDNGVSRYDGYSFKNFDLQDGLSDNTVFKIIEDKQGKIWFATHSCKLSYFFNDSIFIYKYNRQLADTMPKNSIINSLFVDHSNTIYLGLNADGCYKISADGKIEHLNPPRKHQESGTAYLMEIDSMLFCYASADLPANQSERIILTSVQKKLRTRFDLNYKIVAKWNLCGIKTQNNTIYLALSNNLISVDDTLHESLIRHPREIISLYEDRRNKAWIGYYKGGIGTIGSGPDSLSFSFLENMSVSSILQDHEGGYWFTTLESGLFYIPDISILQFPGETNLSNIPANALSLDDRGNIFIGLQDGSVCAISGIDYQVKSSVNISTAVNTYQVFDFLFDPPSKLWVASAGNLNAVHSMQQLENLQIIPLPCSKIVKHKGSVWGGQYTGITKFNDQQITYQSATTQPAIRVNALLPDSSGDFWIGSMDGLWKFQSGMLQYLGAQNPLLQFKINDIKTSEQGILLATEGAGLLVMNRDTVLSIGRKEGISNSINSIFVDYNSIIWLASTKGVSKVQFQNGEYVAQNLSGLFGLTEQEVSQVITAGKDLLIAGKTGFKIIRNYLDKKPGSERRFFISGIRINHKDTSIENSYDLPFDLNSIRIDYKSISFKQSHTIEYKYRLTGLDSNWYTTTDLTVQYPSLLPGRYIFEVSVSGVPLSEQKLASVIFNIHPPFWKASWFIFLSTILLTAILSTGVYIRIRMVVNKSRLLQDLNEAQQKALSAQMNPHFIFNSLNSIHNYFLQNKTSDSSRYLTKFAKLMRMVLDNSMEKLIPIEQEVKALETYTELENMRFKDKIKFSIEVDERLYSMNAKIPPLLLQPYVENAILHGLAIKEGKGTVRIIIKKDEENLSCIIEDDGVGRARSSEVQGTSGRKPKGMNITENRIRLINSVHQIKIGISTTDLINNEGIACGTRVLVNLPIVT